MEINFDESKHTIIKCNKKQFSSLFSILNELMEDFKIGFHKNIDEDFYELYCENEDFDKLTEEIRRISDFQVKWFSNGFWIISEFDIT